MTSIAIPSRCTAAAANVVAAMFAGAVLVAPAPAKAVPPAPLAPACDKYEFQNGRLDLHENAGLLIQIQGWGQKADNLADYVTPGLTPRLPGEDVGPTYGPATGGISGRTFDVSVNWS